MNAAHDLSSLTEGKAAPGLAAGGGLASLAEMRERQHRAARAAAAGASERDLAALLGVSLARARSLLGRPAMRDLIAHYRAAT